MINRFHRAKALLLFLLLIPLDTLHADETHVIKKIIVNVTGKTRPKIIKAYLRLKEGQSFKSAQELGKIVKANHQKLVNYRVFSQVSFFMRILNTVDDVVEWEITYNVTDAFTIAPIPYPKYNSNTGFRLGFKGFYDNAFGTMSDLYLGLGIDIGPNKTPGNPEWEIGNWNINPRWDGIRIGPLDFFVSYNQSYEIKTLDTGVSGDDFHYSFHSSQISIGSSLPLWQTGIRYGFSLAFNMRYSYTNYLDTTNFTKKPFDFTWNHSISLGHVDWKKNFRFGQALGLGHSLSTVLDPNSKEYFVTNTLNLAGTFYRPFARILNYYSKASMFFTFNTTDSGMGSDLRGVADDAMLGNWGMVISNTLAIQFWRLKKVWDAQVHVFFDIGMTAMYDEGIDPQNDIRYSAGLDFVLYVDFIPNLILRGMIGADLSRYEWNSWDKYEITISSSLHY